MGMGMNGTAQSRKNSRASPFRKQTRDVAMACDESESLFSQARRHSDLHIATAVYIYAYIIYIFIYLFIYL